jgi:hypothetical protein
MKPFLNLKGKRKTDIVEMLITANKLDIKIAKWTIYPNGEEFTFTIERFKNSWILNVISTDLNTYISYMDTYNIFYRINGYDFCYEFTTKL